MLEKRSSKKTGNSGVDHPEHHEFRPPTYREEGEVTRDIYTGYDSIELSEETRTIFRRQFPVLSGAQLDRLLLCSDSDDWAAKEGILFTAVDDPDALEHGGDGSDISGAIDVLLPIPEKIRRDLRLIYNFEGHIDFLKRYVGGDSRSLDGVKKDTVDMYKRAFKNVIWRDPDQPTPDLQERSGAQKSDNEQPDQPALNEVMRYAGHYRQMVEDMVEWTDSMVESGEFSPYSEAVRATRKNLYLLVSAVDHLGAEVSRIGEECEDTFQRIQEHRGWAISKEQPGQ